MKGIRHVDPWIDRLSEYLDGELSPRARRHVERHLAVCDDCAAVLAELRQVAQRAAGMPRETEPVRDLWPGIARRLDARATRLPGRLALEALRGHWLRPRFAAAAVTMILVGCAAAIWFLGPHGVRPSEHAATVSEPAAVDAAQLEYQRNVADLHREADSRLTFDPHVVEVLDENLATLDAAIATYREALSREPGNKALRARLQAVQQRKLKVLQQAVALTADASE